MSSNAHARIDGIVAPEANIAVVFRRGPSKLTEQLVWDLNTDEIKRGQWIRGRVYTRRCDVSPDGRYLVGAFTNYSSKHRDRSSYRFAHEWMVSGWTAVSRPPYFTALALWFTGGAWNGGGVWTGPRNLSVNKFHYVWKEAKSPGRHIKVKDLKCGIGEDEPIYSLLLQKRGWQNEQAFETTVLNPDYLDYQDKLVTLDVETVLGEPTKLNTFIEDIERSLPKYQCTQEGRWLRDFSKGSFIRLERLHSELWQILDDTGHVRREFKVGQFGTQWLDLDSNGCVIFGDKGCLWKWTRFPDGEPELVLDLNSDKFSLVPPPTWAEEW